MTGSTTMLESGLGVEIVGKSGREISEICSLVTRCKIGQGSRLWGEMDRERHAVLGHREWKDGEEGGDKIYVKKKWEQVGLYKWTFDINSECWIYMQD